MQRLQTRLAGPMLTGNYYVPAESGELVRRYLQPGVRGNPVFDAAMGVGAAPLPLLARGGACSGSLRSCDSSSPNERFSTRRLENAAGVAPDRARSASDARCTGDRKYASAASTYPAMLPSSQSGVGRCTWKSIAVAATGLW